ncbi:MAG: hypothetical protein ABW003_26225, partial [Microvirga sp.]
RRSETGIQDPLTTLMLNRGSCRDFAILMIEAVRALGLNVHPSRVSDLITPDTLMCDPPVTYRL